MKLEELELEAQEDLRLDESNLIKSSMDNGLIISRWIRHYNDASEILVNLQSELNQLECLLTLYYKGKANEEHLKILKKSKPFQLKLSTETDVSKFIKSTGDYINLTKEIKQTERIIKYIEEIIQNVKFQHLRIQNIISYKKFLNGE